MFRVLDARLLFQISALTVWSVMWAEDAGSCEEESADVAGAEYRAFDRGLPRDGQWRNQIAVADMNRDGYPDIVHGPPRKGDGMPAIFLGDGTGQWRRWTDAAFPQREMDYGGVTTDDFNQDGHADIALAIHHRGMAVFIGDGESVFADWSQGLPQSIDSGFSSRAVESIDWDGDGDPDLVALGEGPTGPRTGGLNAEGLRVFLNEDGEQWRALSMPESNQSFGDSLAVGFIDGDMMPDAFVGSNVLGFRDLLKLGQGAQGWKAISGALFPESAITWAVALGDVNGDAFLDLIYSVTVFEEGERRDTVYAGLTTSQSEWRAEVVPLRNDFGRVTALAAGDLDGDVYQDLVVGNDTGRLAVFHGSPDGVAAPGSELSDGENCTCYDLRLVDLDGDGRDEIVGAFAGEGGRERNDCANGGSIRAWKREAAGLDE